MLRATLSVLFLALSIAARTALAQQPAGIDYTLRVDTIDLSGATVEMRVRGAPLDFRIAMVAHTEYDDKYWRYLTDLRGESVGGTVAITREDSALWRVKGPAGDVTLRYRVRFPPTPPMQQASWMAHLGRTGGLIGGPHLFLYVVGAERAPVRATVVVPNGWRIVTGLDTTHNAHSFAADGIEQLVDSPMLVGLVRTWQFNVQGVPHGISFLGRAAGVPFDSALLVSQVERFARETVGMFGRMPYRRYEFLFEDGAFGGLEHTNSVSIGTQSSNLARDPNSYLGQIAHEFFHTWNEVHLRPATWIGVRHVPPEATGELWWSEGVTLYYADLLRRRAGLPTPDSTRTAYLTRLITSYYANPSHAAVSPERTSRAFNQPIGATGDFTPSMFTQGEALGAVLDLMIRDGSGGKRSLDDAMRAMSQEFSMKRGFTGGDVERAVAQACSCNAAAFFAASVRGTTMPDFNRWLGVVGLRATITWAAAVTTTGASTPDVRFTVTADDGSPLQLNVWFPAAPLARAGFHTGDQLESLNGVPVTDVAAARAIIGRLNIGDTLRVAARHGSEAVLRTITIAGYDRPTVKVDVRADATPAQRALLERWMAGR